MVFDWIGKSIKKAFNVAFREEVPIDSEEEAKNTQTDSTYADARDSFSLEKYSKPYLDEFNASMAQVSVQFQDSKNKHRKDMDNPASGIEMNMYTGGLEFDTMPKVAVFGGGAVGGYVAYFLASFLPVNIRLADYDVVEGKHTKNGRTIYEAGHIGMKKVDAAKQKIERDYPKSKIIPIECNINDLTNQELHAIAQDVDLIINAVDDGDAMFKINDVCYAFTEILFVAMHSHAASGHAIITTPSTSPCLRCCMGVTSPDDINTLHGEPGDGIDIAMVAMQSVAIAIEIIRAKKTGSPIDKWDIRNSIFYFANRRDRLHPEGPGVVLERASKRSKCPICSANPLNFYYGGKK